MHVRACPCTYIYTVYTRTHTHTHLYILLMKIAIINNIGNVNNNNINETTTTNSNENKCPHYYLLHRPYLKPSQNPHGCAAPARSLHTGPDWLERHLRPQGHPPQDYQLPIDRWRRSWWRRREGRKEKPG